jgi:hypothetical protein
MCQLFICRYKFGTPFEREIKQEVFKIVRRGSEFGTPGWYFRCAFYVAFFFGLQYLWVTTETSFLLAVIYGVSQAFIGLNVQHDANHGAASRTPWVNDFLGLGADFIGGSRWLWLEQHWTVSNERWVGSLTFLGNQLFSHVLLVFSTIRSRTTMKWTLTRWGRSP